MQFAGQRTDMELNPIGEPFNLLIKMTPEVVPEPDAVMVTGITPQATLQDGVTEAEFLKVFFEEVVKPETVFLGYNTVRFDDEFMRFLLYRNYYDAYEWQWCDRCSRWDLLDVVRMTRALRPEGIEWPFNEAGKATNRLELLTTANGLAHEQAHDALNDVHATIAVARLIRDKQPKLFDYLLGCRHKKEVEKLACEDGQPFVYACGRYPAESQKTTVAIKVGETTNPGGCLVYDLRHDPAEFLAMMPQQLAERWEWTRDEAVVPKRLPVKELKFNRCPAVAPLGVLDAAAQERIGLDMPTVQRHIKLLQTTPGFTDKLQAALRIREERRKDFWPRSDEAEGRLYDDLVSNDDKKLFKSVRAARPEDLIKLSDHIEDERLREMLPRYKARNYPDSLTAEERSDWETYVRERLMAGGPNGRLGKFFNRLTELAADQELDADKRYLLEELQLYGQSLVPTEPEPDS